MSERQKDSFSSINLLDLRTTIIVYFLFILVSEQNRVMHKNEMYGNNIKRDNTHCNNNYIVYKTLAIITILPSAICVQQLCCCMCSVHNWGSQLCVVCNELYIQHKVRYCWVPVYIYISYRLFCFSCFADIKKIRFVFEREKRALFEYQCYVMIQLIKIHSYTHKIPRKIIANILKWLEVKLHG